MEGETQVISCDVIVIGAGPAGLMAALRAGEAGAGVLLIDREPFTGGQLVKQTHRFFGSKHQYAGTRGFDIAVRITEKIECLKNVKILLEATALGYYEDGVLTVLHEGRMLKFKGKAIVVATGAHERFLPFENNDLPGVYGAGAVQTLMNVYGVLPAKRILMVGAGNIGLIVSYQLVQAGVEVAAIIEAAPRIGGYLVHASKVRRLGVPIMTGYTIKRALGKECVRGAIICKIDENWNPVEGTEIKIEVDAVCLAVGLSSLCELLWQAEVPMVYIPELGGHVPLRNEDMETPVERIYVAGDAAGIEEATSAMLEGELAGINAVSKLGYSVEDYANKRGKILSDLKNLRSGPVGEKIRAGLARLRTLRNGNL